MSVELIDTELKMCRICLQDELNDNLLINPCRCAGTSKYVHKLCLDTWRNTNIHSESFLKCMECNTYYIFEQGIEELKLFFYDSKTVQFITYFPSTMIAVIFGVFELLLSDYMLIDLLNFGKKNETDYNCYEMKIYSKYNGTINRCEPITLKGFIKDNFLLTISFYLSFIFFIQSMLFILFHRYVMCKYTIRLKKYWGMYKTDYILRLIYYNKFIIGYYTYIYDSSDTSSIGTYVIFLLMANIVEGLVNIGFFYKHKKRINHLNDARDGITILPYIEDEEIELDIENIGYTDEEPGIISSTESDTSIESDTDNDLIKEEETKEIVTI